MITILLILACVICRFASNTTPLVAQNASPAAQKTTVSVIPTPMTPTPTPQPVVHCPPKTEGHVHGLAAKGDANAIHEFHSETVGLAAVYSQPKREVTVDPGITGQRLAEDVLAYFDTQHIDSPCGSIVFVYHNQGEANDAYTAGLINFSATNSSGSANTDPNTSNLQYNMKLDIGPFGSQQEYTVTY